jgi:hypothetical protein
VIGSKVTLRIDKTLRTLSSEGLVVLGKYQKIGGNFFVLRNVGNGIRD